MHGFGCANVLIKGGHFREGEADDFLYLGEQQKMVTLSNERIDTRNNHGTGCTLSSAIAAGLAHGREMAVAVREAKEYINGAILSGKDYELGQGHGPVHHFYRLFAR